MEKLIQKYIKPYKIILDRWTIGDTDQNQLQTFFSSLLSWRGSLPDELEIKTYKKENPDNLVGVFKILIRWKITRLCCEGKQISP